MSFLPAFKHLMTEEGGYVVDPNDPGGETKYGISKKQYPNIDIKALTMDQAEAIYRRDYWDKLPFVSEPVDSLLFNAAVNVGVRPAIKFLQRAIHAKDDGYWGPKSQRALDRSSVRQLVTDFCAEWARYYALLDDIDDFYARGWMSRVMRALLAAIED